MRKEPIVPVENWPSGNRSGNEVASYFIPFWVLGISESAGPQQNGPLVTYTTWPTKCILYWSSLQRPFSKTCPSVAVSKQVELPSSTSKQWATLFEECRNFTGCEILVPLILPKSRTEKVLMPSYGVGSVNAGLNILEKNSQNSSNFYTLPHDVDIPTGQTLPVVLKRARAMTSLFLRHTTTMLK